MFGEAIRLNPSNAWALRNRADVHKRKGCFHLAVADFEQASKFKAIAKIFFELGYAYEYLVDSIPRLQPRPTTRPSCSPPNYVGFQQPLLHAGDPGGRRGGACGLQ